MPPAFQVPSVHRLVQNCFMLRKESEKCLLTLDYNKSDSLLRCVERFHIIVFSQSQNAILLPLNQSLLTWGSADRFQEVRALGRVKLQLYFH